MTAPPILRLVAHNGEPVEADVCGAIRRSFDGTWWWKCVRDPHPDQPDAHRFVRAADPGDDETPSNGE